MEPVGQLRVYPSFQILVEKQIEIPRKSDVLEPSTIHKKRPVAIFLSTLETQFLERLERS